MVLVDTSVWIDHLRDANARLGDLLLDGQVVVHPFVIGEIALGALKRRADILELLDQMPGVPVASDREVRALIERRGLMGQGIGLVDAHLLASAMLADVSLWTFDRRLGDVAAMLRIA
jgi:predicted nucleic acid-binding protein